MIETARLTIRPAQPADRDGLVELHTDPAVRAHLGGPRPHDETLAAVDAHLAAVSDRPTVVTARHADTVLGMVGLDRRSSGRPGHVRDGGEELEVSYVFRKAYWGQGFAYEAVSALLADHASEHEDEPVLLVTQTANTRSIALMGRLGFDVVERFEEFGAEQTLAVASLHSFV